MKALLIGGTGTISSAITKRLAEIGWETYLLNRGNRNGNVPENVKLITADINNESEAAAALGDMKFDVVCDFICFHPEQAERDFRLFNGRTKQFIFIRR